MVFRLSTGDFGVDNYKDETSFLGVVAWIIWLIAVLVLNIILMNFLIAVISESYERVMQRLVAESYKVKVHMIVEKEQLFSNEEKKSEKLFPSYLVIRKPVDFSNHEGAEW